MSKQDGFIDQYIMTPAQVRQYFEGVIGVGFVDAKAAIEQAEKSGSMLIVEKMFGKPVSVRVNK